MMGVHLAQGPKKVKRTNTSVNSFEDNSFNIKGFNSIGNSAHIENFSDSQKHENHKLFRDYSYSQENVSCDITKTPEVRMNSKKEDLKNDPNEEGYHTPIDIKKDHIIDQPKHVKEDKKIANSSPQNQPLENLNFSILQEMTSDKRTLPNSGYNSAEEFDKVKAGRRTYQVSLKSNVINKKIIDDEGRVVFTIYDWYLPIVIEAIKKEKGWSKFNLFMRFNHDVKIIRKDYEQKLILESYSGPYTFTLQEAEEELCEIIDKINQIEFSYGWFFFYDRKSNLTPVNIKTNQKLEQIHDTGREISSIKLRIHSDAYKVRSILENEVTLISEHKLLKVFRYSVKIKVDDLKKNAKDPLKLKKILLNNIQ